MVPTGLFLLAIYQLALSTSTTIKSAHFCFTYKSQICLLFSALAIQQLVIHTQPQYLAVSWHTPTASPSKWNIAYSVPGTRYHSFLSLAGTNNSINISTTEYPGVLYSIKLFASNNGSSSLIGWGYARAGNILKDFKNATFYVDRFLHIVELTL